MQQEEFLGRVQDQAGLAGREDAVRACRATLETLGEWMPASLADNLAAQLPPALGEDLRRTGADTDDELGNAGFIGRIADRAGVGQEQAALIAHAVTDALAAATEGGLMARVTETLPADFREYVMPQRGAWGQEPGQVGYSEAGHRAAGGTTGSGAARPGAGSPRPA
ncbi:MAG TPA: DUF2267 domain-containing protein [Trebonia sp.]|nr:DUF2267 domain-containing protein [Trebonia sp.]